MINMTYDVIFFFLRSGGWIVQDVHREAAAAGIRGRLQVGDDFPRHGVVVDAVVVLPGGHHHACAESDRITGQRGFETHEKSHRPIFCLYSTVDIL